MAIEFRCESCSKLLRVGEENSGKQAKCPECGSIATVPMPSQPVAPTAPADPFANVNPTATATPVATPNPFGQPAPLGQPVSGAPINPYAAPAADSFQQAKVTSKELVQTKVGIEEIFASTWAIYKRNLGSCVLISLIYIAAIIVMYAGIAAVFLLTFGALAFQGGQRPNAGALLQFAAAFLVVGILFMCAFAWLEAGVTKMVAKMVRGEHYEIGETFSGGPLFLRFLGYQLIVVIIQLTLTVVCRFPGILMKDPVMDLAGSFIAYVPIVFLYLTVLIAKFLIADRGQGVFQALGQSSQYMRGNKVSSLINFIVVFVLGTIFVIITCGIGSLFLLPYILVMIGTIYAKVTGQRTADAGPQPGFVS